MKVLIYICVFFILFGCVDSNRPNRRFSNSQQEEFDKMLAQNNKKHYNIGNKILEKEYNDSVKMAIGEYMDSVKLFVNWEARIKNINSSETGSSSVALFFELQYNPEEYREVTFEVDYLLPKDSLQKDKIYNTVKNLSNYSIVYFDGFIRRRTNGEAHYGSYSDDLMHSYPKFKFFIVDINTASKGDSLSINLQRAVDLSYQAIKPLELNFKHIISKKESTRRVEKLAPQFNAAKEVLTSEEKMYVDRLTQALTYNFLYAQ